MEPTSSQSERNDNDEARHQLDQKQPDPDSADLDDDVRQAEYRKAYLEQLRRLSCPGCGDDEFPF